MMFTLPDDIAEACAPLFEAIPFNRSMEKLTGSAPKETALVEKILESPALANRPTLAAALWLYVDDLDRSHTVSQSIDDATGAYWHGIMHRREGDFYNSHYWINRTTGQPLLESTPDLDPHGMIDAVAAARGRSDSSLVARQRAEWQALFEWCAVNATE